MSNTDTAKNTTQITKKMSNTDTAKNTTQINKKMSNTDTAKNTTQITKKMNNTDTTKNTTQITKKMSNTDTAKNTTQKTKKMSNTDTTKNTTQKTKKMSNTDTTKNTTQKTKKMNNTDTAKKNTRGNPDDEGEDECSSNKEPQTIAEEEQSTSTSKQLVTSEDPDQNLLYPPDVGQDDSPGFSYSASQSEDDDLGINELCQHHDEDDPPDSGRVGLEVSEGTMGNSESTHEYKGNHDLRNTAMPIRLPMPDSVELERRFTKVLASMDLPPDKAKLLKSYDDDKKWDLICDQERVHAKDPPHVYLGHLRAYLDPRSTKSARKRKLLSDCLSTQVLRDLEISLRTNNIEWVHEFLNEENHGLDVLVDYLSFTQVVMRREQLINKEKCASLDGLSRIPTRRLKRSNTTGSPRSMRNNKLNMGEARDDVHVCIMCLRAIMNHQYGFNLVIAHKHAINCIALSLNHKSLRTKALVLELLAAVCLVSGGHEKILSSFYNFKQVCGEAHRFETLMDYFKNYDEFHIDFMVACMQFVNIVVHSVENMNFRIHLQYEFTTIGLDDYLGKLRHTESDRLSVQVHAYLDNTIDVAQLLEDSEMKTEALERAEDLEDELSRERERFQELEDEAMAKTVELEKQLSDATNEREELKDLLSRHETEVQELRQIVNEKDEESKKRQSMLEQKLKEMEQLKLNVTTGGSAGGVTSGIALDLPPPPPPAVVAPPPPPPPPPSAPGMVPPPPPPPPGVGVPNMGAMTIKKKVQTKFRLPVLNWTPLRPQQVKGTVFSDLDDEKLYTVINFNEFEEIFRLGGGPGLVDDGTPKMLKKSRKPEQISLLEANRLRNCAITRRKIELSNEEVTRAINYIDLTTLSLDMVEILLTILPNDVEVKAFRMYEKDKKPLDMLTDEDRFLFQLCKVERLSQKLHIMSFIGNFCDTIHNLQPQVNAIIASSMSIRSSQKVKKILEVILAFGNYMNSAKRGPVYGFKLQSLDMLMDTKSKDKNVSLMHYLVKTVQETFPELLNFESELRFIEKAAIVSMENIVVDMNELDKGMDMTKKEYEARKHSRDLPVILKDFLNNSEDKLKKLQSDLKTAKDSYKRVVEYYGENPTTVPPNTFFSHFVRFVNSFKGALIELDKRRKMEYAAMEQPNQNKDKRKDRKQVQHEDENGMIGLPTKDAVVSELKNRTKHIKEKKLLNKDEVYHGALEDILLDLKNEPYRRADGVRRSQRRKNEGLMSTSMGNDVF